MTLFHMMSWGFLNAELRGVSIFLSSLVCSTMEPCSRWTTDDFWCTKSSGHTSCYIFNSLFISSYRTYSSRNLRMHPRNKEHFWIYIDTQLWLIIIRIQCSFSNTDIWNLWYAEWQLCVAPRLILKEKGGNFRLLGSTHNPWTWISRELWYFTHIHSKAFTDSNILTKLSNICGNMSRGPLGGSNPDSQKQQCSPPCSVALPKK